MKAVLKDNLKKKSGHDDRSEDALLLKQIQKGDKDAFSRLYIKYQPRFLKYCTRVLQNDVALAADIVDEAMMVDLDVFDYAFQVDWVFAEKPGSPDGRRLDNAKHGGHCFKTR